MATELAEKAGRGKRKDLKLQAALDYALFRAGFLQLHISKRRLKSVVTRHWGSPAAAIEWLRDHNHYARMERFYLEAAVAMAQLLEHEELLQRAVTANIEDGWSPEEAPGYVMRWPSVALDRTRIGTPFYSGRAFFWNWAYRHNLRSMSTARGGLHSPATRVRRKKVHDAWLAAGLELDQESPEHQRIMRKILEHF